MSDVSKTKILKDGFVSVMSDRDLSGSLDLEGTFFDLLKDIKEISTEERGQFFRDVVKDLKAIKGEENYTINHEPCIVEYLYILGKECGVEKEDSITKTYLEDMKTDKVFENLDKVLERVDKTKLAKALEKGLIHSSKSIDSIKDNVNMDSIIDLLGYENMPFSLKGNLLSIYHEIFDVRKAEKNKTFIEFVIDLIVALLVPDFFKGADKALFEPKELEELQEAFNKALGIEEKGFGREIT